jgi:DNA-binding MarR family transcriptional regulator
VCQNSENEFSTMADVKPHEYSLLNEIAQDSMVTQAGLSDRLGIAVGSVNWYIKRLVERGWVKVSHLDRTRLKYDLTSKGMAVFTKRALFYARDSLKVYSDFRNKAKNLVNELKQQGISEVYLDGNDELIDILRLTCLENGMPVSEQPAEVTLKASGKDFEIVSRNKSN